MTGNYKQEVESIIKYSQEFPFDVNASKLLEVWKECKRLFIKSFNGELRVRSDERISISLSPQQKNEQFKEFLSELDAYGVLTPELEVFLQKNKESFFENKVNIPFDEEGIKVNKGEKLSKSFKKFIDKKSLLRAAQDCASKFIQKRNIEGYLYLSVDPRDFLTLSENNEGWGSCHSLDSDYRSGNLSYMTDTTTIVAYIADEEKSIRGLPADIKLPSKKWRMLIHIGDNCVYYSKQYPYYFASDELLEAAHDLLKQWLLIDLEPWAKEYSFKEFVTPSRFREVLNRNQITIGSRVYDSQDLIDETECLGYIDLIHSLTYTPIISLRRDTYNKREYLLSKNKLKNVEDQIMSEIFGIKIGGNVPCPCCNGKNLISETDKMLCDECISIFGKEDFFNKCVECGHRIPPEDKILYDEDGNCYCKKCFKGD